jgi:hypothetical protein
MTIMSALAALCLLAVPTVFGLLQIRDFSRERKQR